METIAFYSYKGGVGRTLLVANAARFLGMLGKRVVALDLDVEAPGLHYKLGRPPEPSGVATFTGGAVPYLVETAKGAKNPPPLKEHMVELALPEGAAGWLRLMPAGSAPRKEYWNALKQLKERLRFDDPNGRGLAALLDLHARIQDELKPDYLLIDSRTGVTELGGLATTALADCVVCLLVANAESVDGTVAIAEALKSSSKQKGIGRVRVVPVIARNTGDIPAEGRTTEGIGRLMTLGEGRGTGNKADLKPFILPHDSILGAADKVVGGDQKASAFSPLHKAYLELFQHLVPQAKKEANDVLRRLEAVAGLRKDLTESSRRHSRNHDAFNAWEDSAIEEGTVIESERGASDSRYADLVCRDAQGEALMIVEYVPESKKTEVLEYWSEHSHARCVILLCRKEKQEWTERNIYCRSDGYEELQPAKRYEPPAPIEFQIYANPGARTVDEALEALHHGNEELVPEMISQWWECMVVDGMKGPGRWHPVEARRILDGLAATEKTEVAVRILRHASKYSSWRSDYDDLRIMHRKWMMLTSTGEELFAPLLWRLPLEAAFRYLGHPEHPGWSPCLAGHRLLAEDVMGLRYDPVRSALKDEDLFAAQALEDKAEADSDDERALHRVYRRLFRNEAFHLSEDPPSLLLWDQKLRKDRYWIGELGDIDEETREKAKNIMGDASRLRTWLRGRISKNTLVTSGLLGHYESASGRIEIYPAILEALAPLLGLQPRYLKSVVFIQLSVTAIAHQARDCDGQPGYGFAVASHESPFIRESPAHITVSQYFSFRLLERLGDMNLMGAFEKLSEKQPYPYRRWRKMRGIPIEQMRAVLMRVRLGEAALGLPNSDPEA